jgi:hypothetical protein
VATKQRLIEVLTTAMEKPEIANALIQRVINELNKPQREWVGLTDDEIADMHHEIKVKGMGAYKTEDIYRAIEAKLKEKNG